MITEKQERNIRESEALLRACPKKGDIRIEVNQSPSGDRDWYWTISIWEGWWSTYMRATEFKTPLFAIIDLSSWCTGHLKTTKPKGHPIIMIEETAENKGEESPKKPRISITRIRKRREENKELKNEVPLTDPLPSDREAPPPTEPPVTTAEEHAPPPTESPVTTEEKTPPPTESPVAPEPVAPPFPEPTWNSEYEPPVATAEEILPSKIKGDSYIIIEKGTRQFLMWREHMVPACVCSAALADAKQFDSLPAAKTFYREQKLLPKQWAIMSWKDAKGVEKVDSGQNTVV